jgi:hypothetical protein
MVGGVLLHSREVTRSDYFDEFGEIDGGYQRFVALADVVKSVIGVDDEAVDDVADRLGHFRSGSRQRPSKTMSWWFCMNLRAPCSRR